MSDFWTECAQYSEKWFDQVSADDDNKSRLSILLRQAEDERRKLEAQFNPNSSSKDEKESCSLISQLENGISSIEKILEQRQRLKNHERKLTIDMKTHEEKVESISQEFRMTVKRLNNTTRIVDYLRCLETLLNYSDVLEKSLSNQALTESLKIYSNLANLTKRIHDSPVEHLRNYSGNLLVYWYEQLKVLLSTKMKDILQTIEYPYVNKKPSSYLNELFDNHREELKEIVKDLLEVRLVQGVAHVDNQARLKFIDWKAIPLLVQFLLKDLIMRFNFHFYGKKETNDRRKPEWFLNEIISWILLHDNFLREKLQPLLDELSDVPTIDVKVEFIRGLIELVIVKLDSQMNSILVDESLFTHYVEEILTFSQRLFDEDINYPKNLPNCMNWLCDEIIFEKWFHVEKDVARLKLENIFKSKTAHQVVYERLLERNPDDIKLSECAETFLTLIHAMEDRYRLVRYPSRILRLFSLQLSLFAEFLEELKISSEDEQNDFDPLSKKLCSILNSIVYVGDVVERWKINPYYQRLQFFYEQYEIFAEQNGVIRVEEENSTRIHIDSLIADDFDSIQLNKEVQLVRAKIFDNLIEFYRDEQEKHVNNIVNHFVKLLKSRSRRYLNEKWSTMPTPKEYVIMKISPSAADVLVELQMTFSTLSMNLVKTVSDEIRARIIMEYDEFIFNCVITDRSFNEGGAAQFLFDFNHGWSRVSTDHIAHLFKKCRESALLLTLPVGSAILLRQKLEEDVSLVSLSNISLYESELSSSLPSALHEIGVLHLSEFEANQVLQHRLDLVQR